MLNLAWLIAVIPLAAFILNAVMGEKFFKRIYHLISIFAVLISFIMAAIVLVVVAQGQSINQELYRWIFTGQFKISIGFLVDPLTALMMVIVTFVSLLVHIYSVGYMHGERGQPRYFSFLSLFTFSMLMLVLANNFLQLYVFWEAVGLCSYLLIGFWYERKSASDAGKKAFIVNRIGDFGFALGIMLIFMVFKNLNYSAVFHGAEGVSTSMITAITLLLFMGAMGKSAQFPLHVWLPDAMEGPTPVSALIHAATMVTAGIYMVARLNPLYTLAPDTLQVIMYIGAFTAIFAASIGLVQNDIKKVLAYSTISQLGYMFLALGAGAYVAAIFHLMTHAFFKALLFLGSGVVIHKVHTMDMKEMGGLFSRMKITAISFIVASAALAGIPPLSGFWSKEMILASVYDSNKFIFWLGIIAASMTAFYISRACYLTFFGQPAKDHHLEKDEQPDVMNIPLVILAVFAVIAGLIGASIIKNAEGVTYIDSFLEPVFMAATYGAAEGHEGGIIIFLLSFGAAIFGFFMATIMYLYRIIDPDKLAARFKPVYLLLLNKYYIDEIYHNLIVRPIIGIARISLWTDLNIVDGIINGIAMFFKEIGQVSRRLQNGVVQRYMAFIGLGMIVLIFFYLYR